MKHKSLLILSILAILTVSIGCSIFNPDVEIERRLSLNFTVDEIAEDISREADTLRINDFRFALRQFNLIGDEIELGSSEDVNAFIFSYDQNADALRLVIDVGLGIAENINFNSYKMFLRPVPDNADILDSEFFGENRNYSIIIKGVYNGKNFTLRSSTTFDKVLNYEDVQVNESDETLVLIKSISMEDVFVDENDQLIDPTDSENRDAIISNIQSALKIEGYSSDYY